MRTPHSSPVRRPKKECMRPSAAEAPASPKRFTIATSRAFSFAKSRGSDTTNVGSVGEFFESGFAPSSEPFDERGEHLADEACAPS